MVKGKKYTTQQARKFLEEHGYIIKQPNYEYQNLNKRIHLYDSYNDKDVRLSMSQIEYQVYRASSKRPKVNNPELVNDIMNVGFQPGRIALTHDERQQMYDIINDIQPQLYNRVQQTRDERLFSKIPESWDYINYYIPANERDAVINQIKRLVPDMIKKIRKGINQTKSSGKDFELVQDVNSNNPNEQQALRNALMIVLKMLHDDLLKANLNITMKSNEGKEKNLFVREDTIDLLEQALFHHDIDRPRDSNEEIINMYFVKNIASIKFKFSPLKADRRTNGGFFPFINLSTIDLSDYGIYGKHDERRYTESCLVLAIEKSGVLTDDEIKRLKHFVLTRRFILEELPKICKEFNVQINIRLISNEGKDHHKNYGDNKDRIIKLKLMYSHYMIDKLPMVSSFFLNNYEEFKNGDKMISKNKDGELFITKSSLAIDTVIKRLIEMKLLVPMTEDEMIDIMINFKRDDKMNYNHQRLIEINNLKKKVNPYAVKPKQSNHFFGYEVNDSEIDERLKELQEVIDTLPLRHHINVSDYYRYSELMYRIMFEYGCFDGVYESTGINNQKLRNEIKFPRPYSNYNKGHPFEIREKLYYIDMNSSYMSFINGIPTDLTMNERNFKINELIQSLFELRCQYKQSNPKLATTLKFIMNSCYGYSLRKQKDLKKKFTTNLKEFIDKYNSFIFEVYITGQNKGFVNRKECFGSDYNCVQFGYDILKNYNNFMTDIKNKVNVIYENIDAILICESDFHKLEDLGLIGDKLGQFKVEHIFQSFEYQSPRKWKGIDEDGIATTRGKWK